MSCWDTETSPSVYEKHSDGPQSSTQGEGWLMLWQDSCVVYRSYTDEWTSDCKGPCLLFFVTASTWGFLAYLVSSVTPRFTAVSVNGNRTPPANSTFGKSSIFKLWTSTFEPNIIACVFPTFNWRDMPLTHSDTRRAASEMRDMLSKILSLEIHR